MENKPAFIQQYFKDAYLCEKEESTTSCQMNVKDFNTIALKSPACDFARYQPTTVVLDPEYANMCINVKKNNFVKTFVHTWAQGTKKNKKGIFGWFLLDIFSLWKQLQKADTRHDFL